MTQLCLWEHVGNTRNRVNTSTFTPASLTTAEEQTQPRCPSTEEDANKTWSIRSVNDCLSKGVTWKTHERTTRTCQEQDTLPSRDTALSPNVKEDSSSPSPSPTDLESLQDRKDAELDPTQRGHFCL